MQWYQMERVQLRAKYTVNVNLPESFWALLYGVKLDNFTYYETESVIYVELHSMQECIDFFLYNDYPGGAIIDLDYCTTSSMAIKAYISYADGSGRYTGYVEAISNGVATVLLPDTCEPVELDVPSLLNRPHQLSDSMIIIHIEPVRVKYSKIPSDLWSYSIERGSEKMWRIQL